MFRPLITSSLLISLLVGTVAPAFADKVSVPIDCSCKIQKIALYGDENDIYQTASMQCYLSVESNIASKIQKAKDELKKAEDEKVKKDAETKATRTAYEKQYGKSSTWGEDMGACAEGTKCRESMSNLGTGLLETVALPFLVASSAASPLIALFSQIDFKKHLIDLTPSLFETQIFPYHGFLDKEIFGKAISEVSRYKNSEDLENALKDLEKDKDSCSNAENPKPECVVARAMCNYQKYVGIIFAQSGQQLSDEALQNLKKKSTGDQLQTLLLISQQRDQALLTEAEQSQEALDTAIAVYSQFFNTYALHLKLKDVIEALVKVRDRTASLRELVSCLPNKFVGVATTKCN